MCPTVLVPLFLLNALVPGTAVLPDAPPRDWALLFASGLVGIGLGQSLFYRAVPVIGVATSSSLSFLIPFAASLISWLAFGERLSAIQIEREPGDVIMSRSRHRSTSLPPARWSMTLLRSPQSGSAAPATASNRSPARRRAT